MLEDFIMTEQLVKAITKLQDGEQFERYHNYVIGNLFQTSKFLDVNSHKILRMIDGLRDKFYIHSQIHKADHFYSLCQRLLKSSAFKENGIVDVNFSILSFLFELAERPTEADYDFALEKQSLKHNENFSEYSETVDVSNVNRSARNLPFCHGIGNISTSDLSEWSSDGEEEDVLTNTIVPVNTREDILLFSHNFQTQINSCTQKVPETRVGNTGKVGLSGRAWIYQNVQDPLLDQIYPIKRKPKENEWLINASILGENCICARDDDWLVLSERQIIREVIWIIEGRKETRVFKCNNTDGSFSVNPKIRTLHLTQDSVSSLLGSFVQQGNILHMLKPFIEDTLNAAPESPCSLSQTYQAYAASLSKSLRQFTEELRKLEKVVIMQEVSLTLAMLKEKLDAWGRKLSLLGKIHYNGVQSCQSNWPCSTRAAHLLNTLFLSICDLDALGGTFKDEASEFRFWNRQLELVMSLFLKSIRPYVDIMDTWMTLGVLKDPCQEFIIARNTNDRPLDETFWDNAIILKELPWGKHGLKNASAVPFLQPVMQTLILNGKSVEILCHLGAFGNCIKNDSLQLYSSIISSFSAHSANKVLQSGRQNLEMTRDEHDVLNSVVGSECKTGHFIEKMTKHLHSVGMYDPILTNYFKKEYFRRTLLDNEGTKMHQENVEFESNIYAFVCDGIASLPTVFQQSLISNISKKYEHISSHLVNILNNDYHLKECLFLLRRYFLMKAGNVMHQFSSQMFDLVSADNVMNKQLELSVLLEDALAIYFPKDVSKLTVRIDNSISKECRNPINAYDCVQIVHQIPWPLNIIINSKCKQRYNQVFSFLMQIKYAKYRLDDLQIRDSDAIPILSNDQNESGNENEQILIQKMYLCRMKLRYFVNGLHHYILTRLLYDTEPLCDVILERDSDLPRLIAANEIYTNAICECCLLQPRMAAIKQEITKILNLALVFHHLWKRGIGNIRWEEVLGIEHDLDSTCNTIEVTVQYLSFQQSSNFLESLVSSCCYSRT